MQINNRDKSKGKDLMNQKKILSTIIIGMMLASVAIAIAPTINADSNPDYNVSGQVYVDGEPTDGVKVILSAPGEPDVTNTSYYNDLYDTHGVYIISFNATEDDTVSFTTQVGYNYLIPSFPTLLIDEESPYTFYKDLFVHRSTTNPPNKPVLVAPSNGTEFDSGTSSVTLKVDVSDPDGDWMDVYFYDAGDDSLIGTAIGIPDGGTAQVGWSGLTDDTTYNWYAIANDSIKESESSDTWSFTIKAEPYTPPDPGPPGPPGPPGDGDDDDDDDDDDEEGPIPNNAPLAPTVNGSTMGTKETNYTYSAITTDADGDNINYTFDWDDGTNSSSGYVANNTMVNATHQWAAAGVYQIRAQAWDDYETEENGTPSGNTSYTVLIDALWVKDIGYILDNDTDSIYETFYSNETEGTTTTEYNDTNGTYLINSDGVEGWDWVYDPVTDTLTEYVEEGGETTPDETPEEDNTILYMLALGMIIVIAVLIGIYLVTKKKETPKKPKK